MLSFRKPLAAAKALTVVSERLVFKPRLAPAA
jgi:hypothetical protein